MSASTIKVILVVPSDCNSINDLSPIMKETEITCRVEGVETILVKEDEDLQLETVKTDFVVFEKFEGELYKNVLRSKSVSILSPLCLLYCVQTGTCIPRSEIPIVSVAMMGCVVVCSCLPKESKKDLMYKVQSMSGIFSTQLVSGSTHLITNGVKSEKYIGAVKLGIKIMTVEFIDELWESSKIDASVKASDPKFEKYKCPPFLNLNVCSTGFTKGESQIPSLVTQNGGNFNSTMDVQKTDILVCKGSTSQKYKSAMKFRIDCVTEDWIFDSIQKGYALSNLKDYAVKVTTSTPTKQAEFVEPNLSQISMIYKPTQSQAYKQQVEETIDQSYFLNTNANAAMGSNKRKSPTCDDDNDVIDSLDIKKVKLCGSYLDGCMVYLAGFKPEHNEKLCKIINFSGATRCDTLNDRITHVIIGNPKCHELKQIKNKDLPCAIVNVKWLVDSMRDKKPIDVENYLISSENLQESPKAVSSSPMSKKGLNLLRSNVTLVEDMEDPPTKLPAEDDHNPDADLMKHYKNSISMGNSVDNALAAFTLNPTAEHKTIVEQTPNKSNVSIPPVTAINKTTTSQSISVTLEESAVSLFVDLKFAIVNYSEGEEDYLIELIREQQGKVVSKNYKGIPDYVVVPIANSNLHINATHVVTHLWLADCCEQRRLITELEYYHQPFSQQGCILEGLVISLSGFNKTEKDFLVHVIERLGGIQQDSLSRVVNETKKVLATTHLVAFEPSGKKYQGALKWGLPIVDKKWLLQCAEENRLVDDSEFLLGECKERRGLNSTKKTTTTFKTPHRIDSLRGSSTPTNFHIGIEGKFAKQSPQVPKLDISVRKEVFTPKNVEEGSSKALMNILREQEVGCATPPNGEWDGPVSSQVTPANEIMKRVREMCGGMSTPRECKPNSSLNDIPTPDSPLGICFEPNPSPATRKMWARWLNKLPSKPRRLSTPFSEIKRRYWEQFNSPSQDNYNENDINVQNNVNSAGVSKSHDNHGLIRKLDFEEGDVDIPERENQSSSNPEIPDGDNDDTHTNDHLLIERINELESIMMGSGGPKRRSSMKKIENKAEYLISNKESQPLTVGWDENLVVGSTSATPQQPSSNKPKHFMLSGVDVNERESLVDKLERLGATVSCLSNYDPSSTHLLCEKLNRNEKFLSSVASGLWILHLSFVEDSLNAGKFLNEEDYEFGNPKTVHKFKLDANSLQRAKAAHYWRQEINRRGYGAFHDIRAIVIANKKEPMIRVLQAGGAKVVDVSPPFEDNISATHCFIEDKNVNLKPFIPLAQQGILCVNTFYVNDFLQRTAQDVNDYIVSGFNKYY